MLRLRIPLPRLPLHHLHRAFPELDGYTDEQCLRFIRASRGSWRRRCLRSALVSAITLMAAACSFTILFVLVGGVFPRARVLDISHPLVTWYGWALNLITGIFCVSAAPLTAYVARDFLLIRRVRRILRTRGTCPSCRYTLVGLAVAPDLKVTCPECGNITVVDPSLGELATDEAGRPRFKPDDTRHWAPSFWTHSRIRRVRRTLPWAAAIFIGLPLLLAGTYELIIRRQASAASEDRDGLRVINDAMLERALRDARPSDPNAWDSFDLAAIQRYEVDQATWRLNRDQVWPDFGLIYMRAHQDQDDLPDERKLDQERRVRELTYELLVLYRDRGLYETLEDMAARPLTLRLIELPESEPLVELLLPHLGEARSISHICAARAHLAARAKDRKEFLSALESGLAIVRLLDHRSFSIEQLVASAIEWQMLERLTDSLVRGVPDDWIEPIHEILDRQIPGDPDLDWLECERIVALDTIAWVFADPDHIRFGRWSPFLADWYGTWHVRNTDWSQIKPLGTYQRNKRAFSAAFDEIAAFAAIPIPKRDPTLSLPGSLDDLLLAEDFLSSFRTAINSHDRRLALRRAARTMVAVERFRIATGAYPASLAGLVPEFLSTIPIDPWSDAPFGYKRVDPAADPYGRGYLLYSVGYDLTDNDGASSSRESRLSTLTNRSAPSGPAADFVFNEPVSPD